MAERTVDTDLIVDGLVKADQLPTYIYHGANASYARPTGVGVGVWVGTVEPNNIATATDFWIDTSAVDTLDGGDATTF